MVVVGPVARPYIAVVTLKALTSLSGSEGDEGTMLLSPFAL